MLTILLALAGAPTPAWSYDIHRLVCDIAWRELRPETRAAVGRVLGAEHTAEAFAESCTWADRVRSEGPYRWTAPAHYVNLPRGAAALDVARDCDTICVVTAIPRFLRVLADRTASDSARREALEWVSHFVADVHQPLHAGYGDDRGGNSVRLTFFGDSTNLHRLWDGELPRALGLGPASGADLHALIRPVDRTRWQADLDPGTWATESFAIVERQVYADVVDGAAGQDYVERNRHTVIQRIQAAGVRLAALLERALSS